MTAYAETTTVPIDRSQAEVRSILNAHGCTKFLLADEGATSIIRAVLEKKGAGTVQLAFKVSLPAGAEFAKFKDRYGYLRSRTPESAHKEWTQECRRRWRCLVVVLKAKFAAVESGIESFQDAFLANLVLPSGETVGAWAGREIGPAIAEGRMPAQLRLESGA